MVADERGSSELNVADESPSTSGGKAKLNVHSFIMTYQIILKSIALNHRPIIMCIMFTMSNGKLQSKHLHVM